MYTRGGSRWQRRRSSSCMHARGTRRGIVILSSLLTAVHAQNKPDITEAWGRLFEGTAAETPSSAGRSAPRAPAQDFLNHFFLESRSEFVRQQIGFSGLPTVAGFTPQLDVFPGPFQPSANTIYETLTFGTRGWLSPRVGTDFSIRHAQDLTRVNSGSPAMSILETF